MTVKYFPTVGQVETSLQGRRHAGSSCLQRFLQVRTPPHYCLSSGVAAGRHTRRITLLVIHIHDSLPMERRCSKGYRTTLPGECRKSAQVVCGKNHRHGPYSNIVCGGILKAFYALNGTRRSPSERSWLTEQGLCLDVVHHQHNMLPQHHQQGCPTRTHQHYPRVGDGRGRLRPAGCQWMDSTHACLLSRT